VPASQVAPGLRAPEHPQPGTKESLRGPQSRDDNRVYQVWQKTDAVNGPPGRYLVDDSGAVIWLVDPGINGAFTKRPDGTEVRKLEAPKATLMSYIIKGMLGRKLPWGVVLFGVMSSVVLELCGVSSLAFAVGVYLPISTSAPIFVGGLVRWLVDYQRRHDLRSHHLDEAQLIAESDKSAGVLLASGYIAGGAIAGIVIAFMAVAFASTDAALTSWATAHNPFYTGPNSDWLALLPFFALTAFLYFVGRELLLSNKSRPSK